MSKPRGHNAEDYTLHPARRFGLDWSTDEGPCKIFFLSERAATLLRKMVQVFPKYYWVWGIAGPQRDWTQQQWDEWDAIQDFVSETEAALVSGCDAAAMLTALNSINANLQTIAAAQNQQTGHLSGLNDATNRLTAAVAGETITVDETPYDYSQTGVAPMLNRLRDVLGFEAGANSILVQLEYIVGRLDPDKPHWAALQQITDLSNLPSILTELQNLQRLPDIETALGQLSDLASLADIAADLDSLTHLDRLPDMTTNLSHLLPMLNELNGINTDLDALTGIDTSLVDIAADLNQLGNLATIAQQLQAIGGEIVTDMTLQDLIDEITTLADPNMKDILELLTFIKDLAPQLPGLPLGAAVKMVEAFFTWRFRHNLLTLNSYQATAQRGIQNALAPFDQSTGDDESDIVTELYENLDKIPWLLHAGAAFLEPTPGGELTLVARMALSAQSLWGKIQTFWDAYIANPTPQDPQPTGGTVTELLASVTRMLVSDNDAYAGSSNKPSLFGMLQGLALTQLHDNNGSLESTADLLAKLADNLPEGTTLVDLANTLNAELQAVATSVNNVEAAATSIAANVQNVSVSIDSDAANDADLIAKLEELRVTLETRLTAETTAGNTRSDKLEAMLNAVEDVLGGTYEPPA